MKHTKGEIRIEESKDFKILVSEIEGHLAKIPHGGNAHFNFERIVALWNAFNGISTHDALNIIQVAKSLRDEPDAVKYLEYGAEMELVISEVAQWVEDSGIDAEVFRTLLKKLEGGE